MPRRQWHLPEAESWNGRTDKVESVKENEREKEGEREIENRSMEEGKQRKQEKRQSKGKLI